MKILVYRLGSLGDTLLALPCFHAMRTKFPQAEICLLTNSQTRNDALQMKEILVPTGTVDEVLTYPLATRKISIILALIRSLKKRQFDVAVHLAASRGWRTSLRDLSFLKLIGAKKIIGVPFAATDLSPTETLQGTWEWEAARLARRVRSLVTVNLADPAAWDLAITAEDDARATHLLGYEEFPARKWIVASVGTKSDTNDWTEPNWLELIRSLRAKYSERGWAMIGAETEFQRSERFLNEWLGPKVNLCGRTSFRVSAAVLKKAELFVGHDSGPMHLAATVNTRCVAIFSGRNFPGQWFPKGEGNRVFYHRTPCFGCGLERCMDHAKKCILSVTPHEVADAIQEVLEKTSLNRNEESAHPPGASPLTSPSFGEVTHGLMLKYD
ncbi:MAG: glycosyltransferase family 9 protein [Verrucomicrobia bacterium]|nr:MAG: glycosyltransferase family 9 protein [Verrucomicrobiota bacterium]